MGLGAQTPVSRQVMVVESIPGEMKNPGRQESKYVAPTFTSRTGD